MITKILSGHRVRMPLESGLRGARCEFEEWLIKKAMDLHGGNVTVTARYLGMDRGMLYYHMKRLGIFPRNDDEKQKEIQNENEEEKAGTQSQVSL